MHEIFLHLVARFFPELFRQIVGRRFADERFAAAGRAVEQKSFRRGVLEFLEKLAVQERQLDRVLDRLERLVLAADFFPGQFRHVVEVMFARLRMGENFQGDPVIRIDPNFIAGFELASSSARRSAAESRIAIHVPSRPAGDRARGPQ